jgi:hypothetical protein
VHPFGPETLAAARNHAAESGVGKVREAVALAAFERGIDGLAKGEVGPEDAPAVFHHSIGRLFRAPGGNSTGLASQGPASASLSKARHEGVAMLQGALNDANRVFGFADQPLEVDGDVRLTDHLGRRLGIGEPDLMDNPARGFGYALGDEAEPGHGKDGSGAFA